MHPIYSALHGIQPIQFLLVCNRLDFYCIVAFADCVCVCNAFPPSGLPWTGECTYTLCVSASQLFKVHPCTVTNNKRGGEQINTVSAIVYYFFKYKCKCLGKPCMNAV